MIAPTKAHLMAIAVYNGFNMHDKGHQGFTAHVRVTPSIVQVVSIIPSHLSFQEYVVHSYSRECKMWLCCRFSKLEDQRMPSLYLNTPSVATTRTKRLWGPNNNQSRVSHVRLLDNVNCKSLLNLRRDVIVAFRG